MKMTIDEAIKYCEELAEKNEKECKNWAYGASQINDDENRKKQYQKHAEWWHERAKQHRQLAEWLRELRESRIVLDILGQFLVDLDIDVCCEDLTMTDDYCAEYCDNQKPLCWYRWAKLKAREVNADGDSD